MRSVVLIVLCVVSLFANAQSYIHPRHLEVTVNKTTNIIFPAQISSVDRGSERIVVQKSTGTILRVKADTAFSDTTNLTVVTSDGKLYSFLVGYAASPMFLNLDLNGTGLVKDTALVALSQKVLPLKNNLYGIRYSSGKVRLSVAGIYTTGELIVCKLRIENNSALSFEAGRLRCYAAGARTSRRRPSQQVEITPLLVNPSGLLGKAKQSFLFTVILRKAALGSGQELLIDIAEKDAERQIYLRVSNKFLLRAELIR